MESMVSLEEGGRKKHRTKGNPQKHPPERVGGSYAGGQRIGESRGAALVKYGMLAKAA